MDELRQVGNNIKKHRQKRGLTQLDLAAACGMDESAIGRLENGNTNPTLKTLVKLAKALDVSVQALVKF